MRPVTLDHGGPVSPHPTPNPSRQLSRHNPNQLPHNPSNPTASKSISDVPHDRVFTTLTLLPYLPHHPDLTLFVRTLPDVLTHEHKRLQPPLLTQTGVELMLAVYASEAREMHYDESGSEVKN